MSRIEKNVPIIDKGFSKWAWVDDMEIGDSIVVDTYNDSITVKRRFNRVLVSKDINDDGKLEYIFKNTCVRKQQDGTFRVWRTV